MNFCEKLFYSFEDDFFFGEHIGGEILLVNFFSPEFVDWNTS